MRLTSFILCIALAAGSGVAGIAQSPSRQVIAGNTSLPLSAAVKADGFVYVSGTTGAGGSATGDIRKQTKDTLDSIAATLKAAGSSLANAASVTVFLKSAADFAAMNEVYATYFPKDPPARTTVVSLQPLASPEGLVEISMIAVPTGGERTVIHPADWMKSTAPYSYGIKSGSTLFLAGLVSRNGKDNSNVPGDLAAQTKVVMDNGAAILKEAGMGFGDVVSSRVWVTEASNTPMNGVYTTYFAGLTPPVRAAVRANLTSADYLVEVTMIAVKDPSRKAVIPPNADGSPGRAGGNLSPAIQVGNRLYIAGMLGNTQTNRGDMKAQTTEALTRIGRALQAAGYDWSNVVDGLMYVSDMTKYEDLNAAYREIFKQDLPARATVGVGLGGDALVEIMLTAVK